jgi:hypothetical protein
MYGSCVRVPEEKGLDSRGLSSWLAQPCVIRKHLYFDRRACRGRVVVARTVHLGLGVETGLEQDIA